MHSDQDMYAPMMGALLGSSMGSLGGAPMGSALDVPTYMPGGGFGGGVRDIGLAQLSQVNPRAAQLAAARLEAEARVNAMGPFSGMLPGALIGAPLGALAGAGLGYAGSKGKEGLGTALVGGGLGALVGGLAGGGISRQLEAHYRRAQAYEDALQQLGGARRATIA